MNRAYHEEATPTLVALSLCGNDGAYEALVNRYSTAVITAARSVTRHHDLAEDAAQDAFVSAWLKLDALKDPDKFGAWVCRIAKNRALGIMRQYRDYISFDLLEYRAAEGTENIEALIVSSEENALLHDTVNSLPAQVREIIRLHYFDGLSIAEIAERMRMPAGTVKWHLHEGRKQLRKDYGAMNEKEADTLVERVMKKVEELKLWQLRNNKDGFGAVYADVLAEVEKLPESAQKQSALADVLLRGWWWLPGKKDPEVIERIRAAAEASRNEEAMQFVVCCDHEDLSGNARIEFMRDKQIPRLKEEGWVKPLAYVHFWLGHAYWRMGKRDEALAEMAEVKRILSPNDVYYANALAVEEMDRLTRNMRYQMFSINATGEVYRMIGSRMYMLTQPGFSDGGAWDKSARAGYVLGLSGACDHMLFDTKMKVGEVYRGSDGESTVTFVSDSETTETPAGTFTDCALWETVIPGKNRRYRTWYKSGVGIVRFDLKEGDEGGVRLLREFHIEGGEGWLPFAPGNHWSYTDDGSLDPHYIDTASNFTVTGVDAKTKSATLWNEWHTIRTGFNEDSWEETMLYVRNGYYEPDPKDPDNELPVDVRPQMERAEALAQTPLEIAHTRVANTVMRRILDTDPNFNPALTAKGHWNFFCYCNVEQDEGGKTYSYDDNRAYSFEWKDMGGTGDAGYPLLYNDVWCLLKDATGHLWSEEWKVGFTAEIKRKYYSKQITTNLTVTDAGTVTTAAGSFEGCICLAIDVQGLSGGWRYRGGKKEYYFAPGVGIVRQVCHFKSQTLTATYDLVEYAGTGEGFFPLCDGLFRRYAAQGLTDGYIGEAEYTCAAREDGGLVVLENRTGIRAIAPKE